MRPKLFLIVLLIAIALLFSCRPGAGTKNRLLIYTPHGQDLLKDFIARYKERYPKLTCSFSTWVRDKSSNACASSETGHRRISGGARHTPTFQTAAEENLLQEFRPTWADKVATVAHDANDRWYGTYETPQVIAYNSEAVTAPKRLAIGMTFSIRNGMTKSLIRNPNPSDTMRAIFGAMILRFSKDTGSPEKGYDWLRKLDANVHEYTADGTLLMQKLRGVRVGDALGHARCASVEGAKEFSSRI
jgi:iron(III) transport system substrate-binding protein